MKNEKNISRSIKYSKEDYYEKDVQEDIQNNNIEINEENDEKSSSLKKILGIIIIIGLLVISYACFIEPAMLEVKEYKVESKVLPDTFHGLKIVQFSDVHYGTTINKKQLDKVVSKINQLKPDIIVFTGDLIDKNIVTTEEIENEIIESLTNLECTLYKYAIYGNEDILNEKYKDIITKADFKLLDDESTLLYYKGNVPILVTGFNSMETNPNYTILTNLVDNQDTSAYYKIVLSHEPDSFEKYSIYKPNLVLSGHSLGGLIKLPLLKPMFLNEGAKKYYEDYYSIDNTDLFVSSGLGTQGINARFNNSPSINLFRLYKENESDN